MFGCTQCFDLETTAQLLAERCRQVTATCCSGQPGRILVQFTCNHGFTRRHAVYRGAADWAWAKHVLHRPKVETQLAA